MSGTEEQRIAILRCSCKNEYQDSKYGKGLRVFNRMDKRADWWRCTTCGKEKGR